jgi:RHS repeat-associated protein
LYHSSTDPTSGYDGLNRLTDFSRGQLNATNDGLVGPASRSQSWQLDALGNWIAVSSDGSTQTRTHNGQNQITSISGANTPGYDPNGNTTADETGQGYVYDAWNRLVQVKDTGGNLLVSYAYDGLNRRVVENGGTARDLYYSAAWQVVEEQVGGAMQAQYVWSPVYVDALVERDTSDGVRLYVQQDANWNVTSVASAVGAVQERYVYDPYGKVTVLDAGWNTLAGSAIGWVYLYQGGRLDSASGLYDFRNRDYSPTLGRWVQQDPAGYVDGSHLYQFVGSDPVGKDDPFGLKAKKCPSTPQECWDLLNTIYKMAAKLANELAKFDPVADLPGGQPYRLPNGQPDVTKPNGHRIQIEDLRRGLINKMQDYYDHCGGGKGPQPVFRPIWKLINQPLPNAPSPQPKRSTAAPDYRPVAVGAGALGAGYLLWQGVKWIGAGLAAPETGGLSLAGAALSP